MEKIILLGSGGHAHSIVDSIESSGQYSICGFLDVSEKADEQYKEYKVIGTDDLLEDLFQKGVKNAFVSVGYMGNGTIREKLYERLKTIGFCVPNIIDPTAVIAKDVVLGEGIFVGKTAVINSAAEIGNMCIINTGAIVEHDCVVEEYSHVSVGSVLCGNVRIGRASFVGANAAVIQGTTVGSQCIVGAGTTVRKNIKDGQMVCAREKTIVGAVKRLL